MTPQNPDDHARVETAEQRAALAESAIASGVVEVATRYYRYWKCTIRETGLSSEHACTPSIPHDEALQCEYAWRGPDLTDAQIRRWIREGSPKAQPQARGQSSSASAG